MVKFLYYLAGFSIIITQPLYSMAEKFYRRSPFKKLGHMKIGDRAIEELMELARIQSASLDEYVGDKGPSTENNHEK